MDYLILFVAVTPFALVALYMRLTSAKNIPDNHEHVGGEYD